VHPILARGERVTLYLATWLLVGVLLATVLTPQGLGWMESFWFLLPVLVVYAFVCLSAWYVCRATPLRARGLVVAMVSWVVGAIVASGLLTTLTLAWAAAM
jgi:hypothetical protein